MRDNYNLRPLWDAILDLYERFDAFCKMHQLRYYATGGTLLGAVRHNGFIPWDDDFDVVMPRPDYEIFISTFQKCPIMHSRLDSVETNQTWSLLFAKLSDTRPDVISNVQQESRLSLSDGICIDIIPIDGMPKSTVPFYYWALKRSTWRHIGSGNFAWRILCAILWPFRRGAVDYQKWLSSYSYEFSPCVEDYNANGRRFRMRALSSESFGAPIMHAFDRLMVPMPREWDLFLKIIYGDYMKLPDPDKRHPTHQLLKS